MKKIVLLLTALFILSGCAGSTMHVVPINLTETGKMIYKSAKAGKLRDVEVTLIRIEF
jgi:uncharacterized protein YceK